VPSTSNNIASDVNKWRGLLAYSAWTLIGAASLIAVGAGVAYVVPSSLSIGSLIAHPLPAAIAAGVLGLTLASAWLYSIVHGPVDGLTRRCILLGYLALWILGLFSLLMLKYYQELNYPIAHYEILPSEVMIRHLILWDAVGGVALAYGLWMGSLLIQRSSRLHPASLQEPTHSAQNAESDEAMLARWGKRLFLIGLAGSIIVVGATHSIALFQHNIDAVRYSQGAGIGFATLAQYELLGSGVIGLFLAFRMGRNRRLGISLLFMSVLVLVVTRAERTPILIMALAALILMRLMGRRPRTGAVFLAAAVLVAGVLYLGVFRLQSQSGGPVSGKEQQVRALLDISPEVRQQAFVFSLFPQQTPYLGTTGILPVGLAVLPGKVLSVAGVNKQELGEDSSRLYTATMDNLGIYNTTTPIRVGLPGELWMDEGSIGLILGMVLYGIMGAWLTIWRPHTPLRRVARALATAFVILALIMPLAALSPIALVTLLPLLLGRDSALRTGETQRRLFGAPSSIKSKPFLGHSDISRPTSF
jgi:hypothetical protein